ncbi:MAG TPA: hypothetical protein VKJ07_22015 [Mycobacteriales bacterium]|nr:hypothetical protein [Mycobacteriales bacterium]
MRRIAVTSVASTAFVLSAAWSTPATWAQNAPPKPSTDCGVTAICPQPTQHVTHPAPLWAVELIMFGLLVVVLLLGYRLVLRRRNVEE